MPVAKSMSSKAATMRLSPDDLLITLYETPGENISFGRGIAQRAHISDKEEANSWVMSG